MSHYYNFIIAPASTLIALIVGLSQYQLLNRGYRTLVFFLGLSVVASIVGRLFAFLFHNSVIVNNIYTLFEFPVLASFFYYRLSSSLKMRRIIIIMIIAFSLMCISLMVTSYGTNRFDDYSTSTESLLLIFLSLVLSNSQNQSLAVFKRWGNEPVNWFNTGILLYFSGSLFVFLLINNFLFNESLYYIAWNAYTTFSICMNVLFTIGFYKIKKEQEAVVAAR